MKCLRKINNKKGSYIMEAAIVLPFIILITITITLILMFFYSQMTERCRLHVALRQEAGYMTGQTYYAADETDKAETDAHIYNDRSLNGGIVTGKKYLVMDHKGVLERKGTFLIEGSCFAVDGTEYIRYRKSIEDMTDDAEQ